jgi:hypothetical protein
MRVRTASSALQTARLLLLALLRCRQIDASTAEERRDALLAFCDANPQAAMCESSGVCTHGDQCWREDDSDPCYPYPAWIGLQCSTSGVAL